MLQTGVVVDELPGQSMPRAMQRLRLALMIGLPVVELPPQAEVVVGAAVVLQTGVVVVVDQTGVVVVGVDQTEVVVVVAQTEVVVVVGHEGVVVVVGHAGVVVDVGQSPRMPSKPMHRLTLTPRGAAATPPAMARRERGMIRALSMV